MSDDLELARPQRSDVDLLVTWPQHCDYPLWRTFVRRERARFARVIVGFSPGHLGDLRPFVRKAMASDDVTFLDTRWEDGWDWRDAAVNACLSASDADWVWFTEQDFTISHRQRFWTAVEWGRMLSCAVGVMEGERWHPCCLFVRRSLVEQTSKYFGSAPIDHFGSFTDELERLGGISKIGADLWVHMAGLSHNHSLLVERHPETLYRPEQMFRYLRNCLDSGTELESTWAEQARDYISWYRARNDT